MDVLSAQELRWKAGDGDTSPGNAVRQALRGRGVPDELVGLAILAADEAHTAEVARVQRMLDAALPPSLDGLVDPLSVEILKQLAGRPPAPVA